MIRPFNAAHTLRCRSTTKGVSFVNLFFIRKLSKLTPLIPRTPLIPILLGLAMLCVAACDPFTAGRVAQTVVGPYSDAQYQARLRETAEAEKEVKRLLEQKCTAAEPERILLQSVQDAPSLFFFNLENLRLDNAAYANVNVGRRYWGNSSNYPYTNAAFRVDFTREPFFTNRWLTIDILVLEVRDRQGRLFGIARQFERTEGVRTSTNVHRYFTCKDLADKNFRPTQRNEFPDLSLLFKIFGRKAGAEVAKLSGRADR